MRVLHVTSEIFPLIKTGGLADVSAALPAALAGIGLDVRVLLPGYPAVLKVLTDLSPVNGLLTDLPGGTEGQIRFGRLPNGVPAYVLDAPALYNRPGNPYVAPGGYDWPDNPIRFAALGWAAAHFVGKEPCDPWWRPDVIHGHDWQAGLTAAYLELLPERFAGITRPGTVMTIHNIAYQGQYDRNLLPALNLPQRAFHTDGVEYYGGIGFLKAGCLFSDRLTTVSPTYALEIQTSEHGAGLDGLLAMRSDVLSGILNGVDYTVWDPATDSFLPANYSSADLSGKAVCKAELQAAFGLDRKPDAPIACIISRLTSHKGLDLVLSVIGEWVKAGGQLVVLGSGDSWSETGFRYLQSWFPHSVGVHIGYDEPLSHRIQAGSDVILVPSRSEPCGLTQLYGLKYGTLPLVRRTGGLADTVVDANFAALRDGIATGFQFVNANGQELLWALRQAMSIYRRPDDWRAMQRNAMACDFGWTEPAREYEALYRQISG